MAESKPNQPKKPNPPRAAAKEPRKPLQVMHISRKNEKESEDTANRAPLNGNQKDDEGNKNVVTSPIKPISSEGRNSEGKTDHPQDDEITMSELLDRGESNDEIIHNQIISSQQENSLSFSERIVDEFDFDEDEFLAALDENQPIGNTGEIAKGKVIGVESDGVYVDIGGKAPGFMPKNECGLGVITNIKERFPKDLEVEVLVTREQNADGMVTISCRALELRKSWEKVQKLEKEGVVVQVKINGFNRGGVTCDLEGLRGFIPRSQLENGENHETLVGKTLGTSFLEVNPDTRKLVLSEKKAAIARRFAELEIGQLVEGKVVAVKPYGFFVDLGGISGLLHQTVITNGSLRSLTEIFKQGDLLKALITDLDPKRGRIALNTALLEGPPGELLIDKGKVMDEAKERAIKAQSILKTKQENTNNDNL